MILIIIKFCELLLRISPRIINSLRSYIKHSKERSSYFQTPRSWLKNSAAPRFSNPLLGVWKSEETLSCLIYHFAFCDSSRDVLLRDNLTGVDDVEHNVFPNCTSCKRTITDMSASARLHVSLRTLIQEKVARLSIECAKKYRVCFSGLQWYVSDFRLFLIQLEVKPIVTSLYYRFTAYDAIYLN